MYYFNRIKWISVLFATHLAWGSSSNTEFRSTWVITWDHINRYENSGQNLYRLRKIMDDHVDANMNAVIFQVRQGGTAYYESSYEPWGYYAGYQNPGYDPLDMAIKEAHSRGLELHAWFNVFQTSSTYEGSPAAEHPEWICRDQNGNPMSSYRSLSPGLQEVRDYTIDVAMEIVHKYDIDGLHLDYVRWNEHTNSQRNDPTVDQELKRLDGEINENEIENLVSNMSGRYLYDYQHPYSGGVPSGFLSWEEWWRWSVTTFVQTLHDTIQSVKPHVKLSAAVLGKYNWSGWQGYGTVFQEAALWYNEGYIDHLMPMSYHWTTAQGFVGMLSNDCPNCWQPFIWEGIESGRAFTVGPGSYILESNNVWNNHPGIISSMRRIDWVDGYQFFSYGTWRDNDYFLSAGQTFFDNKTKIRMNPIGINSESTSPPVIVLSSSDGVAELDIFPKNLNEPHWIITYESDNATASEETAEVIDIQFASDQFTISLETSSIDTSETKFYFSTAANRYWKESDMSNIVSFSHGDKNMDKSFQISQNYPNPFKKETKILITSSFKRNVKLMIRSLSGEEIISLLDDELYPGYHVFRWNGKNSSGKRVSSGIYFCSLHWNNRIADTKKVIFLH